MLGDCNYQPTFAILLSLYLVAYFPCLQPYPYAWLGANAVVLSVCVSVCLSVTAAPPTLFTLLLTRL